jgi:hypothetical protein
MMGQETALKVAIDLVHVPTRARSLRAAPLPDGVITLLRIAAGDEATEDEAVETTGRARDVVRQAAVFFIEQVLLFPGADSYRILGASPNSVSAELRRNMALLLRWLHPDLDRHGLRSVLAGKVTAAWNDLKTPERRAAYDATRRAGSAAKSKPGRDVPARFSNEMSSRRRPGKDASRTPCAGSRGGSTDFLTMRRLLRRALESVLDAVK